MWTNVPSRQQTWLVEWSLLQDMSQDLVDLFSYPPTDLLASSSNNRLLLYLLWAEQTQAEGPSMFAVQETDGNLFTDSHPFHHSSESMCNSPQLHNLRHAPGMGNFLFSVLCVLFLLFHFLQLIV